MDYTFSCIELFCLRIRRPPRSTRTDTLFPSTTLFRSTTSGWDAKLGRPPASHRSLRSSCHCLRSRLALLGLLTLDYEVQGHDPHPVLDRLGRNQVGGDAVTAVIVHPFAPSSEERRVGKECVSKCRFRLSPYH